MDLVALLTEVALKFASLPGSRFASLLCHVGIMGGGGAGTAGVVCPCPALRAWAFARASWGMQRWFVPRLSSFYLGQELSVAVISSLDKMSPALEYHLSAIGFCPCLSQCCCLAQVFLPDGVQEMLFMSSSLQSFRRVLLLHFCQTPSGGSTPGSPQYRVSHGQIACGEARPSSQAPFCSFPSQWQTCLSHTVWKGVCVGAVKDARPAV